jgi:predicted house-cleaning NTP pyrophosphatase (Maf/HAM1 superfamily)
LSPLTSITLFIHFVLRCALLCCEQVAHYGREIREKPKSVEQLQQWWAQYVGEPGIACCTAVVVVRTSPAAPALRRWYAGTVSARQVYTGVPPIEQVQAEAMNCCGGFTVTHSAAKPFLGARQGAEDEVIGFPKALTLQLLEQAQRDAAVDSTTSTSALAPASSSSAAVASAPSASTSAPAPNASKAAK